jgi:hypothetical protein
MLMNRNETENEDWYPTLSLRIGDNSWNDEEFKKNGKVIAGYFDTGAQGIHISHELLKDIGITRDPIDFPTRTTFFTDIVWFFNVDLKISLIGSAGESQPTIAPCRAVIDFEHSPFTRVYRDRQALIGRTVFEYFKATTIEIDFENKKTEVVFQDWKSFEKGVANIFRLLGLEVKRNINLSGNQIDIFLSEQTTSGKTLKTIVECKFYKKPVGVQELKELSYIFEFSKANKLADHAILVSSSGFTQDAFLIADAAGIELLEYEDLRSKVDIKAKLASRKKQNQPEIIKESLVDKKDDKIAFVIMPFKDNFKDIYMLGFREVLSQNGFVCVRADEVNFNYRTLDKIRELIRDADIVIAELTEQNPNVYYELGIAHTLNKTVVMCTQNTTNAVFDVNSYNHLVYRSIVDLREKLKKRIKTLIVESK